MQTFLDLDAMLSWFTEQRLRKGLSPSVHIHVYVFIYVTSTSYKYMCTLYDVSIRDSSTCHMRTHSHELASLLTHKRKNVTIPFNKQTHATNH